MKGAQRNTQGQTAQKPITHKYFYFTSLVSIYFTFVGIIVFFCLLGTYLSLYIAIGCSVLMVVTPLLQIIISSLNLKNFTNAEKLFFRIYACFMFISFPTVFFINPSSLPGKDWFYRVPFSFSFIASFFAAFTSIISLISNKIEINIYTDFNTLIPKMAFDMFLSIPLSFSFNYLVENLDANYYILIAIFSIIPLFLYSICGFILFDINKSQQKSEILTNIINNQNSN